MRKCVLVLLPLLLTGCLGAPSTTNAPPAGASSVSPTERSLLLLQLQTRSTDAATRANCIEALQPSNDPRAQDAIEQGLHDPVWVVRFSAAMAAGKRKSALFLPVLQKMATEDDNESVKVAAIYALHRLGDNKHMNMLAETLSSTDPGVRANTALVLGLLGEPSAMTLLQAHARESDARVKFEITAALARLGDARAQNIIASLAVSAYPDDQANAMAVCPYLPSELAATALLLGLQEPANQPADQDLATRRQLVAARSLGKMHSAQGAKVAIDNLTNPNPNLRALAAFALGEMLARQQESSLIPLLDDKNASVQLAAAAAILNIESRETSTQK